MGWSWAAACGVQGQGHIAWLYAPLVQLLLQFMQVIVIEVCVIVIGLLLDFVVVIAVFSSTKINCVCSQPCIC